MRVAEVLYVSYRIVVADSIREIQSVRRRANALVTRGKKCKQHPVPRSKYFIERIQEAHNLNFIFAVK